jgi:hypothetical protein
VKSLNNIAIFMSFGLWSYDFVQYSLEPNMARGGAKDFREKFFNVPPPPLSSASTTARRDQERPTSSSTTKSSSTSTTASR